MNLATFKSIKVEKINVSTTINERVILIQQEKTNTLTEFAKIIGVNKSLISKIKDNKAPVTKQVIALIKYAYPEINGFWLETGDGGMYEESSVYEPNVDYFNKDDELYNYNDLVKKVRELDKTVAEIKKLLNL